MAVLFRFASHVDPGLRAQAGHTSDKTLECGKPDHGSDREKGDDGFPTGSGLLHGGAGWKVTTPDPAQKLTAARSRGRSDQRLAKLINRTAPSKPCIRSKNDQAGLAHFLHGILHAFASQAAVLDAAIGHAVHPSRVRC